MLSTNTITNTERAFSQVKMQELLGKRGAKIIAALLATIEDVYTPLALNPNCSPAVVGSVLASIENSPDEFALGELNSADKKQIFAIIKNLLNTNRVLRILDIGCGKKGAVILNLKKSFGVAKADFVGLDTSPAEVKAEEFTYVQGSIADPNILAGQKFDIIFSTNCFPYIEDKRTAIQNIARLLNDKNSTAFIGVDPAYFGPHAYRMFAGLENFIGWESNSSGNDVVLVIRGGMPSAQISRVMADFTLYPLPNELLGRLYPSKKNPRVQPFISNLYSPIEREQIIRVGNLEPSDTGYTINNWDLFEFLQFNVFNLGFLSKSNSPFLHASQTFYLTTPKQLSKTELITYLINPDNYDPRTRKTNWIPSDTYREMHRLINVKIRRQHNPCQRIMHNPHTSMCALLFAFSAVLVSAPALLVAGAAAVGAITPTVVDVATGKCRANRPR